MKKKILIVIVVVAMMIPLLAVGVSADYSSETGWDAPVGTFEPFETSIVAGLVDGEPVYADILVGMPGEFEGFSYDLRYVMNIDTTAVPSVTDSYVLYNGLFLCYFSSPLMEATFLCDTAVVNYYRGDSFNICVHPFDDTDAYYELEFGYVEELIFYLPEYPLTVDDYSGWELLSFEVYETAADIPHPFLALIELMFDNFSRIIGGLAAGVTGAFTALIWENPEATEKTLSTAAKFIFTIAGLSIGMTVFYMVLRLIRFGRQR